MLKCVTSNAVFKNPPACKDILVHMLDMFLFITLVTMVVSQAPLQTPAHAGQSLRWCTCERPCTSLSWSGLVWELSGSLMTAKAAIRPQ